MSQAYAGRKRIRRSFGRIPKVLDMPNLIERTPHPLLACLGLTLLHRQRG